MPRKIRSSTYSKMRMRVHIGKSTEIANSALLHFPARRCILRCRKCHQRLLSLNSTLTSTNFKGPRAEDCALLQKAGRIAEARGRQPSQLSQLGDRALSWTTQPTPVVCAQLRCDRVRLRTADTMGLLSDILCFPCTLFDKGCDACLTVLCCPCRLCCGCPHTTNEVERISDC